MSLRVGAFGIQTEFFGVLRSLSTCPHASTMTNKGPAHDVIASVCMQLASYAKKIVEGLGHCIGAYLASVQRVLSPFSTLDRLRKRRVH